ncbi:MAG TPA: methylenetetrahydrofolate--tRNA-(uracil(54)-C(5))-methyltransferase (FADH(2)-oxidizing) TrmFO [Candidatus Protoclostridium stercorigallinarum]|uniref:Methylenetetrahydrofolate--tRNA-(uracil-5-)-methyltransferase TrmFO n=1 Tax=Candidatus Protoclostridium stercorigallinarum TaxID=2838741 RepID=A0A9D1TRB9_9FIRM|nr:methylenetetrahydrofolate--tRNA-(uracil(54)-C(5))-methyltransferase (FADH(2)-oxidizing) TrmFO [Candidatus Protoclostridium stercorigallinarum]
MPQADVTVIGAGLAGSEAALTLAENGVRAVLVDCKPEKLGPANADRNFCELVCSNSLKSNDVTTAHGLLKAELRVLGSRVLEEAEKCAVPAGSALAVDRAAFAARVTERLCSCGAVIECALAGGEEPRGLTIIATGPLTLPPMDAFIADNFGSLHFYDAEAPIVSADSIDKERAFFAARYGKGNGEDYLNCPMTKEEYDAFYDALVTAERAVGHEFEKGEIFEGCMPVEVMARRGRDALRFGPMKPVGLTDPNTGKRAYAVLQLRRENAAGDMYNLVGFQTNLKFGEQKRVFGMIPALRNAEYMRYGVMHRNTYIDAPSSVDMFFRSKKNDKLFIAGQLSGVEGYVESIASGKLAAMHALRMLRGKEPLPLPETTIVGALSRYISTPNDDFQPMNANHGLLPPLGEVRDKRRRKEMYAERSLADLKKYTEMY